MKLLCAFPVFVINRERLLALIKRHEGLRLMPYEDSLGFQTIGYGRNIESVGISEDEALYMLNNDINRVIRALEKYPFWACLDAVRKEALIDMTFNLGERGISKFKNMLDALSKNDFERAARESQSQLWVKQTGNRARDIDFMLRYGTYPTDLKT